MSVWLFQANPDTFDIDGYLAATDRITWTVRQAHLADEMQPGDVVYLWRAIGSRGDREVSGVVASGVIDENPAVFEEDAASLPFWKTSPPGPALRVRIRVTKVANKRELLKREWMVEDPVLGDLRILKFASETNYAVADRHAERLASLWANTGRDWDHKDSVAGLWAYDQTYGGPISKLPGSIVANVAVIIGRTVSSAYAKVLNFRYLDPRQEGKGLSGGSDTDKHVWNEFFDSASSTVRSDALDDEFRKAWHSSSTVETKPPAVYAEFGEAPNDDPTELRSFLRALRRGQPAFRRNLLAIYEGKCCVTGWAPETVLEAAHIVEHSKTGLNSVSNGLLLRSDLHALFDEGLLRIDPERLAVVLAPELQGTPYWDLNGRRLRAPVQGDGPSRDLLLARWHSKP